MLGRWKSAVVIIGSYLFIDCRYVRFCSDQNSDAQSVNEIRSLINSLTNTLSSRLEQLSKVKDCARKYEEAFTAASNALTAAKKQSTDASGQCQVIFIISAPFLLGELVDIHIYIHISFAQKWHKR